MKLNIPDTKVIRASVYREAGEARYKEAEFLRDEHPSGAIYLAGYMVECYLKWALCERHGVQYLQHLSDRGLAEKLTSGSGHNLEILCTVIGYDMHFGNNDVVRRAFQIAATWSPNIRYVKSCGGKREAVQFLAAVRTLRKDIQAWGNA